MKLYKSLDRDFTIVRNEIVRNKDLSYKAKGIYLYLVSRPDGWVFRVKDIKNHSTDGRDSVQNGLKELEEVGYLKRELAKNKDGKFSGYDYYIFDTAVHGKTVNGKSVHGKTENGKGVHLLNTDLNKIDLNNTLSIKEEREGFKTLKKEGDSFNSFKSWLKENAEGWTFSITDSKDFDPNAIYEIRVGRISKIDFGFVSKDTSFEIWAYLYSKQSKIREVLQNREVENAS